MSTFQGIRTRGIHAVSARPNTTVVLKRDMRVGFLDAEADHAILRECFIDIGHVRQLIDTGNPHSIVIGRTGTGKTAILQQLADTVENRALIAPEELSMHYITNSTIIQFFEELGVRLNNFYVLLWRHVITCEALRLRYGMHNEEDKKQFFQSLRNVFTRDQAKERALKYLNKWGESFWEQTDYRIKEFTSRLEHELQGSLRADVNPVQLGAAGVKRLSEEQKSETIARAKQVVSEVQLRELHHVMKLLAEDIFSDPQKRYYLIIDRLDEDWVDDKIRYKLIKALIEAVKSFRTVQNLKIVVALRNDLLQRVLEETRNVGFQEEKYLSLLMPVAWTPQELRRLADTRVNYLFKHRYTGKPVSLDDIMARIQIDKSDAFGYILDRTLLRPRDVISFLNLAIQQADGKSQISRRELQQAETFYSEERFQSILDEWRIDYPALGLYTRLIHGRSARFRLSEIRDDEIEAVIADVMAMPLDGAAIDPVAVLGRSYLEGNLTSLAYIWDKLLRVLFQVGFVGLRTHSQSAWKWSYIHGDALQEARIEGNTQCAVHKAFHRVLAIRAQN